MKTLVTSLLLVVIIAPGATAQEIDSLQQWKQDSARISNTSPLLNNKVEKDPSIGPMPQQPATNSRSNYIYDNEGRVTGGNTSFEIKKKKKKGNQ